MTERKEASAESTAAAISTSEEEDLVKLCKQYITCDNDGCDHTNPKSRCSRCHMVFYCGRDCQKSHWKQHKPDCIDIDTMRGKVAGVGGQQGQEGPVSSSMGIADKATSERILNSNNSICCAICQEEEMKNPIVLEGCHHVFCFGCLKDWNEYQTKIPKFDEIPTADAFKKKTPTCPMCRSEIPNVSEVTIDAAFQHIAVAKRRDTSEEERKERCLLAMSEIGKLADGDEQQESKLKMQEWIGLSTLRGEIAILADNLDEALEIFKEEAKKLKAAVERHNRIEELMRRADFLRRHDRYDDETEKILIEAENLSLEGHTTPINHVTSVLKVAEVQRLKQDWEGAELSYQELMREYPEQHMMTPQQHREIYTSFSQCAYEQGRYDMATSIGEGAIEMNRYYPNCHKYVALAYKAGGNMEKARQVAAEAVVYETPWDDHHRNQVQDFYTDFFQ